MSRYINAMMNEAGAEILSSVRAPEFIIPTIVFPVGFYSLFGVMLNQGGSTGSYLLATYGVFAVLGPAIFGFGASIAAEREKGWLDLKRAVPLSGLSYILAKLIVTLVFSAMSLALLYAAAGFLAGVELEKAIWLKLLGVHLIGAIPFALIGISIGFLMSGNGAVAVANVVFLVLSALGGLWLPIFLFPDFMQAFAQALPSFHMGEISLSIVGAPGDHTPLRSAAIMAGMTAILLSFAVFAWRRQA